MPARRSHQKKPTTSVDKRDGAKQTRQIAESVTALKDSIAQDGHATREQDERHERGKKWREIATLLFIVLTTGGVFLQAAILHNTDKAIHVSAEAAKDAAKAAKDAVDGAQRASQLDQRAWVGVDYIDPVPRLPEIGKPFAVNVRIKNNGKTPARKIVTVGRLDPVLKGNLPNFSYDGLARRQAGNLPPAGGITIPINPLLNAETKQPYLFTQEFLDELIAGKFSLYAHGRIGYEDIFGQPHWVEYCAILPVPLIGAFAFCDDHNDTDDYQPPKR